MPCSGISFCIKRGFRSSCLINHEALVYGKGFLGALGNVNFRDVDLPSPIDVLNGVSCQSVSAGWGHTGVLTEDGRLFVAGRPYDFKQTLRNINIRGGFPWLQSGMTWLSRTLTPGDVPAQRIELPLAQPGEVPVRVVCSSGSLTAVLTSAGRVYTFGSNSFGQCGVGSLGEVVLAPTPLGQGIQAWERVVGVALGLEHGLVVTDAGAIYSWGRGDRGQLGVGEKGEYVSPVRITGPEGEWLLPGHGPRWTAVEAGPGISAALDSQGGVWVWGKMQGIERGAERGDGWLYEDALLPRRVSFLGQPDGEGEGEGEGEAKGSSVQVDRDVRPEDVGGMEQAQLAPLLSARSLSSGGPSRRPHTRADTVPRTQAVTMAAQEEPLRAPAAVVALSAGHAHMSMLSSDGRLWMIGRRGRGVGFDVSSGPQQGGEQEQASTVVVQQDLAEMSKEPVFGLPAELDIKAEVPEVYMQVSPLPIPPGPLAGQQVWALRSDLHHTYAITVEGKVYRWGWKGRVEEVAETRGVAVQEAAFGYAHTVLLA